MSLLASKTEHPPNDDEGTCTLSFRVSARQFSTSVRAEYSILHYKSIPESIILRDAGIPLARSSTALSRVGEAVESAVDFEIHQPHAEVLFHSITTGPNREYGTYYVTCMCRISLLLLVWGGGPRFISKLTCSTVYHNTTISQDSRPRVVRISNVLVVLEQTTDPSKPSAIQEIKCNAVDVEFGNLKGMSLARNYQNTIVTRHNTFSNTIDAQGLLSSFQSMQSHLFSLYLTRPLFGDHILVHKFAGNTVVRNYLLPSASLTLVYTPESDMYRIILAAATKAVGVCLPLSSRQMDDLLMSRNAGSKEYPTYFLSRSMEGTEVVKSSARISELLPSINDGGIHPLLSEGGAEGQGGGRSVIGHNQGIV